jgi:ABC-type nitrate/sulfonate/bicarbonate transport system substrate-binding protein
MARPKGILELSTDAVDRTLQGVQQAQEWSLRATEAALEISGELAPAKTVVEWSFDTARKALEQQRAYAIRLTDILTPAASHQAKP